MNIKNLNIFLLLKKNFFDRRIKRNEGAIIIPFGKNVIWNRGEIQLKANLLLNSSADTGNRTGRSSIIRVDNNGKLIVNKRFNMYYGADIVIFSGGELTLNGGFFNSDVTIRCKNQIKIGSGAAISHGVLIQDYDGHDLYFTSNDGKIYSPDNSAPITIGEHVLIFANSTILKGVNIGDGAIIAGGSIVTHDVPAHTLVAGAPAKIIREDVDWK